MLDANDQYISTIAQRHDCVVGTPWEDIGHKLTDGNNIALTLQEAGLDWKVVKRPAWVDVTCVGEMAEDVLATGGAMEIPYRPAKVSGNYVMLRSDTMAPISPFVGPRYKPIQNEHAFEVFRDFCEAGNMTMETAGSMFGGQHIWGLARLQDDYELCDGELISGYFLLLQSHVYGSALKAMFTPVRYPGGHTMMQSVNRRIGMKRTYSMPHSRVFNNHRIMEIKEVMGVAETTLMEFVEDAKKLADTKVSEKDTIVYFIQLFHPTLYNKYLQDQVVLPERVADLRHWDDSNRNLRKVPDMLNEFAGANMPTCSGTAWGLLQASNYAFDHVIGKSPDTRLVSSWIGPNAKKKLGALKRAQSL